MRSWQRDLTRDPHSEIARIARADDERRQVAAAGFGLDLDEFCRAFLDGAIGDAGPFTTQDDALAACERCLAERIRRPLNTSERVKVGVVLALAWNARAAAPDPAPIGTRSPVSPWYAGDCYYANAYDAEIERRRAAEKAAAYARRVAAVQERARTQRGAA